MERRREGSDGNGHKQVREGGTGIGEGAKGP